MKKMLINVLKTMINNLFKNIYKKRKKNNILITFSISHKNSEKTFLE